MTLVVICILLRFMKPSCYSRVVDPLLNDLDLILSCFIVLRLGLDGRVMIETIVLTNLVKFVQFDEIEKLGFITYFKFGAFHVCCAFGCLYDAYKVSC